MRNTLLILLVLIGFTAFVGCQKEDLTIKSITLDKSTLSLTINGKYQFAVTIAPSNLPAPNYKWTTSNNNIVSVNEKGEITAKSVGTATITVSAADQTLQSSCKVNVQAVIATGLSLDVKSIELFVGQEQSLAFKITPDSTTYKKAVWSSADNNIATVDSTGKVKAISAGETKITATTNYIISDVCNVKVNPVAATSIQLSKSSLSLEMSDKVILGVSFLPINTTNKKIIWSSSNTYAAVSQSGEVTGIIEGNCVITAKSEDGGFVANCNVEVKLKGISLTRPSIETLPDQQELIHVMYLSSSIAYTHATWTSSNPSVAKVSGDGDGRNSALITTSSIGTAVISATSADGLKIAYCYVTVKSITDYIKLNETAHIQSFSNGYFTGDLYSNITNSSTKDIVLTSFYMYDANTGYLVALSTDPALLGTLSAGATTNLGKSLSSVYKPISVWNFTFNGKDYQIKHQLFGSYVAAPKMNTKLNLITH